MLDLLDQFIQIVTDFPPALEQTDQFKQGKSAKECHQQAVKICSAQPTFDPVDKPAKHVFAEDHLQHIKQRSAFECFKNLAEECLQSLEAVSQEVPYRSKHGLQGGNDLIAQCFRIVEILGNLGLQILPHRLEHFADCFEDRTDCGLQTFPHPVKRPDDPLLGEFHAPFVETVANQQTDGINHFGNEADNRLKDLCDLAKGVLNGTTNCFEYSADSLTDRFGLGKRQHQICDGRHNVVHHFRERTDHLCQIFKEFRNASGVPCFLFRFLDTET